MTTYHFKWSLVVIRPQRRINQLCSSVGHLSYFQPRFWFYRPQICGFWMYLHQIWQLPTAQHRKPSAPLSSTSRQHLRLWSQPMNRRGRKWRMESHIWNQFCRKRKGIFNLYFARGKWTFSTGTKNWKHILFHRGLLTNRPGSRHVISQTWSSGRIPVSHSR